MLRVDKEYDMESDVQKTELMRAPMTRWMPVDVIENGNNKTIGQLGCLCENTDINPMIKQRTINIKTRI